MTLLELLICIALSLTIVSGLSSIYWITEKNHQQQLALNIIEDNARTAFHILKNDIQYAGYIGCAKLKTDDVIDANNRPYLSPWNRVYGTENRITVIHANKLSAKVLKIADDASSVWVAATPVFKKDNIVMISSCQHAEVFSLKEVSYFNAMQRLSAISPWHYAYDSSSEVSRLNQNTYFVKATNRKDLHGKSISALYVENIQHKVTELVEGVAAMKLKYDVKINDKIISMSADEVTDWSAVKGVSIQLRLSAVYGLPLQKDWYTYIALREL